MGFVQEFKKFALRGNVVDLAVAVIIGGAFGKIVTSLVNDVIMPPIGLALGGVNFKELMVVLKEPSVTADGVEVAAVAIKYGAFINTIVDFLIIAFVIFMAIRTMNKLKKKEEAKPTPPPAPSKEETLLTEIRDILKAK
ncbi:large-conductance mechanosensitive channel protein MscL [Echinicola vietnamensis]|uniref:Large-conductance mechanosensitive channel n=1 Tax=Echinicola vietnamensis (strain DSM 17526 / LMG 23754 / KMM 6221) TaxID=926556 RepID=L0FXE7_ECHVK|nr:large-conductance mechanosensitive channel protein MscL [Echinicola vietnamensis]AGA78554.1 large conductance mechanosensitive channel protein [Echinicola vietnamensis DSM 17526]